MAVDYREQYSPEQLEPFWPNEILRMLVVVLCTLALIMALVVLPLPGRQKITKALLRERQPSQIFS